MTYLEYVISEDQAAFATLYYVKNNTFKNYKTFKKDFTLLESTLLILTLLQPATENPSNHQRRHNRTLNLLIYRFSYRSCKQNDA